VAASRIAASVLLAVVAAAAAFAALVLRVDLAHPWHAATTHTTSFLGKLPESIDDDELQAAIDRAVEFWTTITDHILEWGEIRDGHLKPSEVRAEFVHCHAVGFWALATAGKALIEAYPDEVKGKARMSMLEKIDWRKAQPRLARHLDARQRHHHAPARRARRPPSTSSGTWD
jgi:hypothetical protein